MLWLGEASRRQQRSTVLSSVVEIRREQGPIPASPSRAGMALLPGQADSRDPPAAGFAATWSTSVSESLLSLLELSAGAAFTDGLGRELAAAVAAFPGPALPAG